MKQCFFLFAFLFLVGFTIKSQSSFRGIIVKSDISTYTVSAAYDTAYKRYVEITLNDTLIDSLHVRLIVYNSAGQTSVIKDTSYKAITVMRGSNVPELACYKKSSLIWQIFLGDISLLTKHGIHVDIVGLKPGDTLVFDDEF